MKPETYEEKLERWREEWRREDDEAYVYELEHTYEDRD